MRSVLAFLFSNLLIIAYGQNISEFIHIDQFGYAPNAEKVAVVSDPQIGYNAGNSYTVSGDFEVVDANSGAVVFSGAATLWNDGATHASSGDRGWWFDFSTVNSPGTYFIRDASGNERTGDFDIDEEVYNSVLRSSVKMYYYNRCNMPKQAPYADSRWTDATSFFNPLQDANCRYIYDQGNAALEKDLSGGWFDAGDYNKYVTFSYYAMHDLLWSYRENSEIYGDDWNIPESGNGIPDILDEIKWELDWLMKMTNPDGTVHIKMGSKNHQENDSSPPSLNTDPRYYGPTCTSASLAVASIFANAAQVFDDLPGMSSYATTLEEMAEDCWDYTKSQFDLNVIDTTCDDGSIVSGDADWDMEEQKEAMLTASLLLYASSGQAKYDDYLNENIEDAEPIRVSWWSPYRMPLNDALMFYTTLSNATDSTRTKIINSANTASSNVNGSFHGFNPDDLYRAFMPSWAYHWGSNKPKAGFGVLNLLWNEYGINGGESDNYRRKAAEQLHYFHGVNPLGVTYLTNMYDFGGDRCLNEMYHIWFADGTIYDHALNSPNGPAPGYLVGGPNSNESHQNSPPDNQPNQKSYLDFNDDFPLNSWAWSEPSITYQATYVRLAAHFAAASTTTTSAVNLGVTDSTIEIFPCPTDGLFTVSGELMSYDIDVLDVNGQVVFSVNNSGSRTDIDLSALGSGVYFVRVVHSSPDRSELHVQQMIKM